MTIKELLLNMAIDLAAIKKDVAQNTKDLEEHIRRTDLLETRLAEMEKPFTWLSINVKLLLFLGGASSLLTIIYQLLN